MGKDFKYKMRHIGDAVSDQIENLGHAAKGSVRGIVLTYNIDGLEKEKQKIVFGIGKRMTAGRKEDPMFNVAKDETLTALLSELDRIEKGIETFKKERKERLYPKAFSTNGSAYEL